MPHVARYDDEAARQRRGGDQAVDVGQGIGEADAAPTLRRGDIDVQDAIPEPLENVVQPDCYRPRRFANRAPEAARRRAAVRLRSERSGRVRAVRAS